MASVFLGFTDIPLIIFALVIVAIGAPLQFNKSLGREGAWEHENGMIEAVYGPIYWIKFALAMISAIIGSLFTLAYHDPTDIGALVIGMGFSAIFMAFVNPKYIRKELPGKNRFD